MGQRRGFFAQLEKIAREAEREQRRRQRELQQFEREMSKLETLEAKEREKAEARHAVAEYENMMEILTSIHRQASPPIDWNRIAASQPPELAAPDITRSEQAKAKLAVHKPSFFDKLLGTYKGKKQLEAELDQALVMEAAARQAQENAHHEAVAFWQESVELTRRVLSKEHAAYDAVVEGTECFVELEELGCTIAVTWREPDMAMVSMLAEGSTIVPATVKSLTKTDKLSTKSIPKALFWETYQDFVCGAALRAGREVLAAVPVETVLVNIGTSLFNPATGHDEEQVVLSVYCVRERMAKINFTRADASDVTQTFTHAMKFRKGKGMDAVVPLSPEQAVLASP